MNIFFKPKEKFVSFFAQKFDQPIIISCGIGFGVFETILQGTGKKVLGLDLFPRCPKVITLREKAQDHDFSRYNNPLILFCRPDHGGWVKETLKTLFDSSINFSAIWIGKPENLELDLEDYIDKAEILAQDCGNENEICVMITNVISKEKEEYILVKGEYFCIWYKRSEDTHEGVPKIYNGMGGWNLLHKEDKIVKTVWAHSFDELDYTGTSWDLRADKDQMENPSTGLLSPSGEWFPCRFREHEGVARFLLKKDIPELIRMGWQHFTHGEITPLHEGREMTDLQIRFCQKHNLIMPESEEDYSFFVVRKVVSDLSGD